MKGGGYRIVAYYSPILLPTLGSLALQVSLPYSVSWIFLPGWVDWRGLITDRGTICSKKTISNGGKGEIEEITHL